MYLKDLIFNFWIFFHLLIENHKTLLQKYINWYFNNYVEYKIVNDYEFFLQR